jgi:hypothetical protein
MEDAAHAPVDHDIVARRYPGAFLREVLLDTGDR